MLSRVESRDKRDVVVDLKFPDEEAQRIPDPRSQIRDSFWLWLWNSPRKSMKNESGFQILRTYVHYM